MHTQSPKGCHHRELLIAQLSNVTDELIALELEMSTSSPHRLQQMRERRERLLQEYGEQNRRLAQLYGRSSTYSAL